MAHHSFAMFDRSVEKVATGTVVRWAFNAPHSWLYLNVKNADGSETLWSFEGSAPPSLLQRGITGSTFEPGETVTISYCPMKDGRPGGGLGWARLADGTFLNPSDGGCDGSVKAIEKLEGLARGGLHLERRRAEGEVARRGREPSTSSVPSPLLILQPLSHLFVVVADARPTCRRYRSNGSP